jgi:hypothetical protein
MIAGPARRTSLRAPFDLGSGQVYKAWLTTKLENYPQSVDDLIVEIRDPLTITTAERTAIIERCRKTNMAIYACMRGNVGDKEIVRRLGQQFGLRRLDSNLCADNDSVTSVRVMPSGRHHEYIPYSNRPLSWHTDGYYNRPEQRIRAFLMHCVHTAASGGGNAFLDPEIAYLLMRNENPDYVRVLMQPDTMTIPANVKQGVEIRTVQTGPVFSIDGTNGALHMRYTARKRHVLWKKDLTTQAATRFLEDILTRGCPYIFHYRLQPGQGLICNNVLHARTGFKDNPSTDSARLLYRARYYDRIAET